MAYPPVQQSLSALPLQEDDCSEKKQAETQKHIDPMKESKHFVIYSMCMMQQNNHNRR